MALDGNAKNDCPVKFRRKPVKRPVKRPRLVADHLAAFMDAGPLITRPFSLRDKFEHSVARVVANGNSHPYDKAFLKVGKSFAVRPYLLAPVDYLLKSRNEKKGVTPQLRIRELRFAVLRDYNVPLLVAVC